MNSPKLLPPALLACLGLVACDSDKTTGTMDDTNQTATARVFLPDHSPAAKALVQAWRVDDSSKTAVAQTETSPDGTFQLGDLPEGLYRIVARKDGLVAMQDSMPTVAGRLSPRDDTLAAPAVATGTVKMTGSDNPAKVNVLVMGTDVLALVDKSGAFKLEGLATGTYNLRLTTTLEDYTTTPATIRIVSGKTTDVGTIRMNFTGTPPVDSLRARVDSASNDILLSWSLPDVSDFRFARVYREPLDGTVKPVVVGYSTGSTFRDSLDNFSGATKDWLYTVRIHTLDGDSGYPAWVKVAQPARVEKLLRLGLWSHSVGTVDSGAFEIRVVSSPERPRSLVWTYLGVSHSIAVDSMARAPYGPYAYQDSMLIRYAYGDSVGRHLLRVVLAGADGQTQKDSFWVQAPRDTIRDIDTSRTDTAWTDTARSDTSSTLELHVLRLSGDTLIAGTRVHLNIDVVSSPYRAKSLSLTWNDLRLDTALGGDWDTTWHRERMIDSLRLSFDAGKTTGARAMVLTVTAHDGARRVDSLLFHVKPAIKTDSVASATSPARFRAARAGFDETSQADARIPSPGTLLANKPEPEA